MKLGNYEVLSELGRGGMGVVLRARGPDGQDVALKLILKPDARQVLERFDRERRLLAALGEAQGFVPLLDAGMTERGPFLVMPFVGGGTLRERIAAGPMPVAEVATIGHALASALGRAHAAGIVHRDMKPENVLFTTDGRPLIADLGLAKHFRANDGNTVSVALSKTGELRGTAGYMPPEQVNDAKSVGPPADVFALGTILYECVTGTPTFSGDSMHATLAKIASGDFEPIAKLRPGTPRWLAATIERALAGPIADRYPDGAAFAAAIAARKAGRAPSVLRNVVLAGLVVALSAGAALGTRAFLAARAAKAAALAWAGEVRAAVDALERQAKPWRRVRLGVTTKGDSPALTTAELRLQDVLARLRPPPPEAELDVAAIEAAAAKTSALARAEAALASGDVVVARSALSSLPVEDPDRRLVLALADLQGGEARVAHDALGALVRVLPKDGASAVEARVALARAGVRVGRGRAVLSLADEIEKASPQGLERDDVRAAAASVRRELFLALAAAAPTADELLGLLPEAKRACPDLGLRDLTRAAVLAAVARKADGERLLRALLAKDPTYLAEPEVVPRLVQWTRAAADSGDMPTALRALATARQVVPNAPAPPDLGERAVKTAWVAFAASRFEEWLESILGALRCGFEVYFPGWIEDSKLGNEGLLKLLEDRVRKDDDWAARLAILMRLTELRAGDPAVSRRGVEVGERLLREPGVPDRPRAAIHANLGDHYSHLRRWHEAAEHYQLAIACGWVSPYGAACWTGDAFNRMGRLPDATEWYLRAAALADWWIAKLLAKDDARYSGEAEALLDGIVWPQKYAIVRLGPRQRLAEMFFLGGRPDMSEKVVEEMRAIDQEGSISNVARAVLHCRKQEEAEAVKLLGEAWERASATRDDHFNERRKAVLGHLERWIGAIERQNANARAVQVLFTELVKFRALEKSGG